MRKSLIPIAALAAVALLGACSSGSGESESSESTSEETSAATDETSGAAATGESLVIWVDENRQPAIEAAAADFTAETGIAVETVVKNFEDIRADFLAQVPTGEGPDLTIGAHDWLGAFIVNGVVDSIDLAGKDGEFEDVAIEAFTYDGQLYGLPYALETIAVVRNTALADSTPATFDEMIEKGRAAGTKYPFVINTNGTTGDAYTYYAFQSSFGAPVFEQDENGQYTSTVGMGGAAGEAYAAWLGSHGMAGDGLFSTDWTYDIANQEFADGNAPFTVAGPWAISTYTDAGIDVAVDPIPSAGGETAAPFVGVQGFYLSAQSSNALVAANFLTNYIATEDAIMALYEADPRIPAMSSVAEEVAADPITAGFLASSQTGTPMPSVPEMGDVWEFWNTAEATIIAGTGDPVTTWNSMITDLTASIGG